MTVFVDFRHLGLATRPTAIQVTGLVAETEIGTAALHSGLLPAGA